MKHFWLTYLFCLSVLAVAAQHYSLSNFHVEDGLASATVYEMIQDKKGYIWASTENGVSRFDGTHFLNFSVKDGLPDNDIISLKEDSEGRIWFLAANGELSYFSEGEIFHAQNDTILEKLSQIDGLFMGIHEDDQQNLWFLSKSEGIHILEKELYQHAFPEEKKLLSSSNSAAMVDWQGMKMLPNIQGFWAYKDGALSQIPLPKHARNFQPKTAINDEDGNLLYISGSSLYRLTDSSETAILYSSKFNTGLANGGTRLRLDQEGNLWVLNNQGAFLFSKTNNSFSFSQHILKNQRLVSLLQDREGNYWFASRGDGLFFIPSLKVKNFTKEEGLAEENINSVYVNDWGQVWAGSKNGYLYLIIDPYKRASISSLAIPDGQTVYSILQRQSGTVWIASQQLYVIEQDSLFRIASTTSKSILQDSSGTIWLGGSNVLYKMDGFRSAAQFEFEGYNRVYSICSGVGDTLWLGTDRGLFLWDGKTASKHPFDDPLFDERILDVQYKDGILGLAIPGFGVVLQGDTTSVHLNTETGLPTNSCKKLFFDQDSSLLWIASSQGVCQVHYGGFGASTPEIRVFDGRHGLPSDEVNDLYMHKGYLWVATAKGLSYFQPKLWPISEVPPPCYINNVKFVGQPLDYEPYYKLRPRQNDLRVDFTGLCFRCAGSIEYQYKLVGLDSAWKTTYATTIEYPSLPTGKSYTFQVRARNEDGLWGEVASVGFEIRDQLYQRTWFIILNIVLIIGLAVGLSQIRTRRLKEKVELKQRFEETRRKFIESELKALRAQMNPHFIFNTLNAIQDFIFQNDEANANLYLSRFARLMRMMLENSKKPYITLEEELDFLNMYLDISEVCLSHSFEYELKVSPDIFPAGTQIPSMVLQPYIENAIRHGLLPLKEGGILKVQIERKGNDLVCTIEDNGIGRELALSRKRETQYESSGMKITAERLSILSERFGKDLRVDVQDLKREDGEGIGTKVILSLPFVEV